MISNDAVGEIAAFGALATRYRQYDSRLAPFCAGPLEPQARSAMGRVSRTHRLSTPVRNCTRDEGGPFEIGSQVQVSSHRKLLS
jgi:hypothetical protein